MSVSSATSTVCTVWPLISMPRIRAAFSCASSGVSASFTPPALPRPPVFTWALITASGLAPGLAAANSSATCPACSAVLATLPCGIGTPYSANSSFAWYSKRSTRVSPSCSGNYVIRELRDRGTGRRKPSSVRPARRNWVRPAWATLSDWLFAAERRADPVHDLGRRRAGREDLRHPQLLKLGNVRVRDDAAAEDCDVGRIALG